MENQKKFFTFMTKPLVLFVLLFTVGVGNVWGGDNQCDFYGTPYIKLWVNSSKTVQMDLAHTGVSDLELGVVDALYLSELCSQTWKYNDGNVCSVKFCYGINSSRGSSYGSTYEIGHDDYYGDWWGKEGADKDKCIQQWKRQPDGWNLLDGLTPGQDYYLDFYLHIYGNKGGSSGCYDNQKYRNNNGGNYHVHFRVADSKSTFSAGTYFYFDTRELTSWQANNPDMHFFFKEYYYGNADIGDVKGLKANALENWVYYVTVPSGNDRNGTVEIARVRPDGGEGDYYWNKTNYMYACDRDNASQNCLVGSGSDKWDSWSPTWGTYCPPMSDVDLEEDGTTLSWGGDGSSGTPYLIPTGASIKVKATNATKAVDDDNMTIYYQFKKAGTEVQAGSTTASATITASGSTGTKEAVTVEAYNYYNSTSGTHLASNEIYYEVRTPYTISYNAGTDGSGLRASETKLKGVNFTLPNSAVFIRTGYTQTGWTTSDGGTQTHALGGTYTSDDAQEFFPVWTANPYTVTLNNLEASTAGTESVSVTYDATTGLTDAITKPEKLHYDFGGYYTSANSGATLDVQLIDENGNWKKGVSGYTGTSEDNATWVYAGDITLYAKWTEHEYTITTSVSPAGAGSVSCGSSTTAKYVTASGDITATPSTGYSFREWDFSKTEAVNDIYCADGYSSTSNPVRIHAVHDGTLTANFTANGYTVRFENLGADAGHKGSLDTTVTFNDTIHMKGRIEVPSKTNYDFGGYYISTDKGSTLTNTQIIDANGNWNKNVSGYTGTKDNVASWVCAGDTVLYAKWTETAYTITPSVSPAGAGSVNTVTDAHLVTPSSTITATPANAAWIFDYWEYGEHVGPSIVSGNTVTVTSDMNSTITAHFKPRFSLVGSLYEGDEGGMPGWEDYTKTFAVNSTSPMDLSRTCTLQANKTYKVQVHDNATSTNLGRSGCDPVCVLEENASLLMENSNNDVFLYTSGAGEYIFKITAIDGSDHPTLTVLRPYPVNFGQKYLDIDGTLHTGTTGGTAAATAGSALSSGDYVTYNTSVTHTATPAGGYTFAGWWSSDAFEGARFSGNNPMTYAVTSGDNAYAKFVETSTSVTLANDGHGKVQIGGADATNTTCGVTTTRELSAVPNAGYKFSSWSKSGDDITLSSTSTNPTTLRGQGAGATSGQTVTANFTYRWALKAESDNWGSSEFIIGNISTDGSGDVVGYVEISLAANTNYQFTMKDLLTNDIYKNNDAAVQYMTYTNHTDWGFATNYTFNCGITTAGKGTYRFTWNVTDKTMTVTYPDSYQVNYGASVGGSVSVVDDDSNAVPNGGYVRSGGSVTYTATPNTGYTFVGWCGNDSYGDPFTDINPWTNSSVAATSNAYAKFKSTNFVIYRSGDMVEDDRAALDDVESYDGGTISETIEFRMKVRELDTWYTLCLPFTVSAVKVWEDGEYYDLVPFYRTGGKYYTGDYIIRTPAQTTDFPIADFDNWNDPTSQTGYLPSANTPYIIQWHHSYFAEEGGRYISFFGETGQDIPSFSAGSAPSSDNVVNVHGNNSMQIGSVAGAYLLENDYGSSGAWLRAENASEARTILPFECYILANTATTAKYRVLRRGMTIEDTPTGWDQVTDSETKAHITVYTVSGIIIAQYDNCSFNEAATRLHTEHNEGLFILRSDNESVKLMMGGK